MKNQFAYRLRNARTMAGYSMDQLAGLSGLSKNAISRYENNVMQPDSTNLILLAKALDVKIDYFFRPMVIELKNVEFRKKAKLGKKQLEAIKQRILDNVERYLELESILSIDATFENPLHDLKIVTPDDIEVAANQIREFWKLGMNPISGIIEMLEDHLIKVVEVDEVESFDGLASFIDNKIPVIVVNKNFPTERKRFTLLHELGHLLLQMPDNLSEKEEETLCHRFAGALLIPENIFKMELGNNRNNGKIDLQELISMQKEYGISIKAIMARAKDLSVINQNRFTQFHKLCNFDKLFKAKVDASRYSLIEESLRFSQLLYKAIALELVSFSKASALSNTPIDELRKSLNTF